MRYIIVLLLLCTNLCIAQNAYEIPFPEGKEVENTIELSVANTSAITVNQVKVDVTSIPEGIKFAEEFVTFTSIKAKEEQTAVFTFTVDRIRNRH